jgi:hypothetical protein
MFQFPVADGSGGNYDPTMAELENTVNAAVSFVDFTTTIETIALEIETRQTAFLEQATQASQELSQQRLQAVVAVLEAKNQALAAIQAAQQSAGLDRRAQHNQAPLPGKFVPTSE